MAGGHDDFNDHISGLTDADIHTFTDEVVKKYFNPATEFIFERFLGKGTDGLTFLIREKIGYGAIRDRDRARSLSPYNTPSPRGARSPAQDQLDGLTDEQLLGKIIPPPSPPRSSPNRPREDNQGRARARPYGRRDRSRSPLGGIVTPPQLHSRRIVLKIDRLVVEQYFFGSDWVLSGGTEAAENNCAKETEYLERMENCQHVVNLVAVHNNPLITTRPPLRDKHVFYDKEWLMEEYLENGSLTHLLERLNAKCKAQPGTAFLPNRVLWGLFYCLLKMEIAMAWPDQDGNDEPEECLSEKVFEYIEHGDLHEGNLMFGSDTHCNSFLPVLKLIDLAAATEDNDEGETRVADLAHNPEAIARNLFDIGKVMAILILPGQWDQLTLKLVPEREEKVAIKSPFSQDTFETIAVELLAPIPECYAVEDPLKILVAACMAVDYQRRPRIVELHDFVRRMVRRRDPSYYLAVNKNEMAQNKRPRFNVENETDQRIRDLVAELIHCPPVSIAAQ
ncbi:hypothetical protein F5B22DRAFT_641209 [Xylaria bambusicola]|uniref:uncharacterized protein n=1 Tax=Xylaria bambusicola TaxID=326684 RepID=UPI0020089788|nr:uncharacterized protein F5B22DRAFT_641209 [Xylaria bambusicola]KAI0528236.1 hypothetical protein F5B22DRAFT_641209 [Xylaria bambusicola]